MLSYRSRPRLVLMAGLPGAGKSTLALELGRTLGWPVLDKDTVKSCLLPLGADEQLAGKASYEVLFDLAHDLVVGQALSVILDTPSAYARVIDVGRQIVAEAQGNLTVIFCSAGRGTRDERTKIRVSKVSQRGHPSRTQPSRRQADGDGRREYFPFLPPGTIVVSTDRRQPSEIVHELLSTLHAH